MLQIKCTVLVFKSVNLIDECSCDAACVAGALILLLDDFPYDWFVIAVLI